MMSRQRYAIAVRGVAGVRSNATRAGNVRSFAGDEMAVQFSMTPTSCKKLEAVPRIFGGSGEYEIRQDVHVDEEAERNIVMPRVFPAKACSQKAR